MRAKRPVRIKCAAHVLRLPEIRALRKAEQEHLYAIGLDKGLLVLSLHLVAVGTVDLVQGHARDIFRELIRRNASRFVVVHNHPGGRSRPSSGDREVTAWLTDAGTWLGIPLVAHILVTAGTDPVEIPPPRKRHRP